MDEIAPEVIERFIGKLMDRGNKVTAINARLRAIFVFLPIPPLAEQKRIVDRVNELLAMCDELKGCYE